MHDPGHRDPPRRAGRSAVNVKAQWRGKGIGRKLKAATIAEAHRLGFHSIIARVTEGSSASLHLNQQFGFRLVGTLVEVGRKSGQLLDVHILQKMLDAS